MGNFPTGVTTTFTSNTKAKSAEVNTNFTDVVSWHNSFTKDLKNGTVYLQTSAKSADYTVLDTDGIRTILMTTGASNRTVTLPTAADNTGRLLRVKKVDSGAGTCIIDGEGAETVDGATTYTITNQYEHIDLQCDGTGWHIVAKNSVVLSQYNVKVGNSSSVETQTNTNLLGDVKATTGSATATMTIATPCVVTYTSHGFTSGDKVYFTTTGALPTGLTASTAYYVLKVDANTFNLCTTMANVAAGTKIATSGSQSGTHTIYFGGFRAKLPYLSVVESTGVTPTSGAYKRITTLTIPAGTWLVFAYGQWVGANTAVTNNTNVQMDIVTTDASGSGVSGSTRMDQSFVVTQTQTVSPSLCFTFPPLPLTLSSETPYYLNCYSTFGGTAPTLYGSIRAIRIDE